MWSRLFRYNNYCHSWQWQGYSSHTVSLRNQTLPSPRNQMLPSLAGKRSLSNARSPLLPSQATADTSLWGWDACLLHHSMGAWWEPYFRKEHINILELLGQSLCDPLFLTHGQWQRSGNLDNTTAVAYVNWQGDTVLEKVLQKCYNLAMTLGETFILIGTQVSAARVPGVQNVETDHLSRGAHVHINGSWTPVPVALLQDVGNSGHRHLPNLQEYEMQIILQQRSRDLNSLGDGLIPYWEGKYLYPLPPIPLLPKVVVKLKKERPQATIMTPWWPQQL